MTFFAADPSKAWAERFFLACTPVSIAFLLLGVVGTGAYEHLDKLGYTLAALLTSAPCVLYPLLFPGAADRRRPLRDRFWLKAHVWNGVFGFVGNYLWTHYFYSLLGARYTFPNHRLNDVPVACYLATQAYFCFYHTLTSMVLRALQRRTRSRTVFAATVAALAYATALAETVSIAWFPHYHFEDRRAMYRVGSAFYGMYFVVSFPMYLRVDEASAPDADGGGGGGVEDDTRGTKANGAVQRRTRAARRWSLTATALDACAAAMIVTLLLDAWRLTIGALDDGAAAPAVVWMRGR